MTLHRKKFLSLIILCICCVARANLSSDSDDSSIKEALVLVDLLKTEYIKALRENVAGIYQEENNNTIFEDQSTCATTTAGPHFNDNQGNNNLLRSAEKRIKAVIPRHQDLGWTEHYTGQLTSTGPLSTLPGLHITTLVPQQFQYRLTPPPDLPFYREHFQRSYKPYRRRIPRDYYYYYDQRLNPVYGKRSVNSPVHSRRRNLDEQQKLRFNYDDPFGAHPNGTDTKTSVELSTDSATNEPSSKNTNTELFSPESASTRTKKINSPSILPTTKIETRNKKKLKLLAMISPASKSDPIREQVAAELVNEVKNNNDHTSSNEQKSTTTIDKPTKEDKKKLVFSKKYKNFEFVKTTLKIHLGRSSRYPIPFPENHAFCFTNPKSALCKTQI